MQDIILVHHGIKGMKWGVRRYRNKDGTLTEKGRKRYSTKFNRRIGKQLQALADDRVAEDAKKEFFKYDNPDHFKDRHPRAYSRRLRVREKNHARFEERRAKGHKTIDKLKNDAMKLGLDVIDEKTMRTGRGVIVRGDYRYIFQDEVPSRRIKVS